MSDTGRVEDARIGLRNGLRHIGALFRRNVLQARQDPESMMDALVMPVVFTLLFVYVFGGALSEDRGAYVNYVVPGLLGMMGVTIAMAVGTGIHEDFEKGVMDRFRSMPIARSSVLIAKVAMEVVRLLLSCVVLLSVGFLVGLHVGGRWPGLVGAAGLSTLFGASLVWIFILLGLTLKTSQAIQAFGLLTLMPLQFGSSVFVPTGTMPGWLAAFADANPLSILAEASRNLVNGGAVAGPALGVLLWSAGITAVTAPLAVARFRTRTA
ncbi:ABC transporter permease [Streptomyces hoynatensis]|uniref:Transport permease protein n=1 Tax=Streptomyces hoynatensis TaxID=1141874 RepID=A0A3A9ZD05_9ACTN|nr:ABC transporter permease [Streptomyces hoynatensis]RKN45929.1 ABC transporter permease [Streptomyces hoynatensis]